MERSEIIKEYLRALRIQDRVVNVGLLRSIAKKHVATFAFSSVGCRLGEELPLDFESLYSRIVVQRRGGYYFEQNGLLFEVLKELGFVVDLHLARVIYNQDIHPGLTHRITIVELGGKKYVVDVGFGPLGPRVPVLLSDQESTDDDRIFRTAEPRPGELHMQVFKDDGFFSLYRFELARYGQADCELGHFYSHKHPDAAFVNHLVVSRILHNEVRSLRDLAYWVIGKSDTKKMRIGNANELKEILVGEFGIQVTAAESKHLYDRSYLDKEAESTPEGNQIAQY